jgi:hypothetical protein
MTLATDRLDQSVVKVVGSFVGGDSSHKDEEHFNVG